MLPLIVDTLRDGYPIAVEAMSCLIARART